MRTIDRLPWVRLRRRPSAETGRPPAIELRGITYVDDDGNRVLDGADLLVPPAATVCVVGSQDRDQATLAGLLLALHRPELGSVELDGEDLLARTLLERQGLVSGVLQDPWLIDGTIADNISFDTPGVTRADVEAAATGIGIDRMIRRIPGSYDAAAIGLTLGQRRCIALARAVARNPGVLVLEEPTTDLEPDEEGEMTRAIAAASQGRTTVILTHRLSLARRAATVMVIDGGRIVPYRGHGPNGGHARLWDTRVPPLASPSSGAHLRLVGGDRPPITPTGGAWSISIGSEFICGYLASGLLGRGTHTATWVAWSMRREQPVRVEVPRLPSDSPPLDDPVTYHAWEQLAREHRVLQGLEHPGVVVAMEVDLEAEMPYLVLEYLDSISLARVLQRRPEGLPPLDVLQVGFELAGTLQHVHQRGHVHLDLRASHVRSRDDAVVITDFAQCRPIGAPLPATAIPIRGRGTGSHFFAPEFGPGRPADPTMDIYALGTLMHRATAGSAGTRSYDGSDRPGNYGELAPDIPPAMAEMVDRMLAVDPGDRPDAGEIMSRFRPLLPRTPIRPRASMAPTSPARLRLVRPAN